MYLTQERRSQTPVSQIINDYASIAPEDGPTRANSAPQSYKLVNVRRPEGNVITIQRSRSTRETGEGQDGMVYSSTSAAAKEARRTVLARSSDGSFVRVQRPVRDSELFTRLRTRASDKEMTPQSESVRSSSIYDDDASRGTMISTMTLVETALAEQQTYERLRGIQRGGHSANRSSATGVSGTSGNIEIGHIDEQDEYERSRRYSVSDYGEESGHAAEVERNHYLASHRSRSAHESYITSNARAAFRGYGPTVDVVLPSPLPAARYSDDSNTSTGYSEKLRDQSRDVYLGSATETAPMRPWLQRLVRLGSYILGSCSVVLPIAFIALSIAMIFTRGQPATSRWSTVADLVDFAAIVWPIVFATVVAQCFKAGIIFRRKSISDGSDFSRGKQTALPRLEALCLLIFLIWCLSPIGQQAARHMHGTVQKTGQSHLDVFYIDKTGHNQVWDPESANELSSTSRSELVQAIGAKYIRSLSQEHVDNPLSEPISVYSAPKSTMNSIMSASGSMADAALPHGIRSRGEMVTTTYEGVSIAADFNTLNFSMTASAFEFKCGDWTLMTRQFGNDTSSGQMSYSASQTLGLSMPGYDELAASPTVRLVSLNRKSVSNTTALKRRRRDTSTPVVAQWEYSSISCSYEQVFYDVPMQCSRDASTGLTTCAQAAAAQLVPSDDSLNTPLGNFALDFVWSGNLPTTDTAATATERFIQRGGSSDTNSLTNTKEALNTNFNLSSTVSPVEFAQRFGQLFSTWVGLGYCPQCSSGIVVNSTSVPANLQPRYRKTSSTVTWTGEQAFNINWAWLAVFIVFTSVLLVAAVGSVVVETMVAAKAAKENAVSRATLKSSILPLRLPTMYSTFSNGQRSPQWGKTVMQDMDTAAGAGRSWRMYG
ncbi:hypothetical protein N8I77_004256 [Diaporthe amygdali]|uniref:Uncharacterized protein n=1 Tax=Phomopsis amygdali TaxID=1214568 RepID=A0AAD9SKX9_PHOAM|nr:hypothetical protein N8I77_004256 [Diaporthe amygdali]